MPRLARALAAAAATLLVSNVAAGQGLSLRLFGHGVAAPDLDRVKIRIDDPDLPDDPGPPVDVGAGDFSIEFWMRALASENTAPGVSCGSNIDWIFGNILIDRDRFDQDRKYGVSIAGGQVVFGVSGDGSGDLTLCSTTNVLDDRWHHVALQRRRSDGFLWLHVDGALEASGDGPDGDVSYPDAGVPGPFCGGPCTHSDPFIVLGAEKHDAGAQFPSYSGLLDDLRFSDVLRYGGGAYPVPVAPFGDDPATVALYAFDTGPAGPCTGSVLDVSGRGTVDGDCRFGGAAPAGPVFSTEVPFAATGIPSLGPTGAGALALLLLATAARSLGRRRPSARPIRALRRFRA